MLFLLLLCFLLALRSPCLFLFVTHKISTLYNIVCLKKPLVVQQDKKFPAFHTIVKYLQRPVAGPCINPDETNPHPHALFQTFNIKPSSCQFPSFDTWYISLRSQFISYPPWISNYLRQRFPNSVPRDNGVSRDVNRRSIKKSRKQKVIDFLLNLYLEFLIIILRYCSYRNFCKKLSFGYVPTMRFCNSHLGFIISVKCERNILCYRVVYQSHLSR